MPIDIIVDEVTFEIYQEALEMVCLEYCVFYAPDPAHCFLGTTGTGTESQRKHIQRPSSPSCGYSSHL